MGVIQTAVAAPESASNHPLAVRMGVIAGVSHNVVIGTVMGHFGVMLASAEHRLGITAGEAALGIPLVLIGSAVVAPFAGVLLAKHSLRLILVIGAVLTVCGFALLGLSNSYPLYLVAYGVFLGPAMSLTGSIGPATLVTRWFTKNRGLALGVVHLPVVIAILPVLFGWVSDRIGGARTLALIAFDCAVLWALLLIEPPFAATALIVGLIGMHGAGAIPGISKSITEAFGQASFSRAFGINTVIALPFIAFAIVGSAGVFTATGSYAPALMAMAGFFAIAIFLALFAAGGKKVSG
jgi:hypothetical protein